MRIIGSLLICVLLAATVFTQAGWPQASDAPSIDPRYYANKISELLSTPEPEMDLAAIALRTNQMVDPAIDVETSLKTIDQTTEEVRELAGPNADDRQLLTALREYIYEPGPWNDHRVFSYDHDDPLGRHLPNKLIPNYLESRRGNCVSMPVLFVILGDRLGLPLTLSTAPNHVFVQYADEAGNVINLETTSGAYPSRREWIREQLPMTDDAIENGMYLKQLTKRQTAAVIASTVLEYQLSEGQYSQATFTADALLEVYPEYDLALIGRGLAFQNMVQINYLSKYPDPRNIPLEERPTYNFLAQSANASFERVEELGYLPPDQN